MQHQPKHREQEHRRRQGWKFTYFGGMPEKPGEEKNQVKSPPESTQNKLMPKQVFPLSATQVGDRVDRFWFDGIGNGNDPDKFFCQTHPDHGFSCVF